MLSTLALYVSVRIDLLKIKLRMMGTGGSKHDTIDGAITQRHKNSSQRSETLTGTWERIGLHPVNSQR